MIKRSIQFCFRPTPKDRNAWSYLAGISAVGNFLIAFFGYASGYWILATLNVFLGSWNTLSCVVCATIYNEWLESNFLNYDI